MVTSVTFPVLMWMNESKSHFNTFNVYLSVCGFFSLISPSHSQGAFWGLTVGMTVGCIRMLLDFIYPAPPCYKEDNRPGVLKYVHYLYFSTMLSFITLVVVVAVSLTTEEPKPEQVKPLNLFVYGYQSVVLWTFGGSRDIWPVDSLDVDFMQVK